MAGADAPLWQHLREDNDELAISDGRHSWRYSQLLASVVRWQGVLDELGIAAGEVVALQADFGRHGIAVLLALLQRRCVAALISPDAADFEGLARVAQAAHGFVCQPTQQPRYRPLAGPAERHPLLRRLADLEHGGFVVFSSGSSGQPKAVLHDVTRFALRYRGSLKRYTSLAFLQFDHIAGIDTLFYSLASGGHLVLVGQRTPAAICQAIAAHGVQVLPASPSFLKLLLLAGDYRRVDLSSLKIVTYGSEPMPERTLQRLCETFAGVRFKQKYGASEFGAPANADRASASLWVKLDSPEFQTRVVDGLLWVKSETAMIGYLNADLPLGDDGWFCTGDRVEVDGDWLRILGRDSDLINVGGEKVYPAEVEAVIEALPVVNEAAVYGQPHPMLGQIVCCRLYLADGIEPRAAIAEVRGHCLNRLARYKVPMRFDLSAGPLHSVRQKKIRR